jgi:hypothetical protein
MHATQKTEILFNIFAFDANEEKYFIDFIEYTDMVATNSIEPRFKKYTFEINNHSLIILRDLKIS